MSSSPPIATTQQPGAAPARRERILQTVLATLAEQKRAATELEATVERSGLALDDVATEFPDLDDLYVALAAHVADRLSRPLADLLAEGGPGIGNVREELMRFSRGLHEAYSSVLIGMARVGMTEGSRRREVRQRLYEAGPAAVTATLQRYLERAAQDGHVKLDGSGFEAEALIAMLREPLYRELTLHTQELTQVGAIDPAEAAVDLFLRGSQRAETRE